MKSILDPTFKYTSSSNTDLRKTFARVQRRIRKQARTGSKVVLTANGIVVDVDVAVSKQNQAG